MGSGVTPHLQWRDRAGFGSDIHRDRLPLICDLLLCLLLVRRYHLPLWFQILGRRSLPSNSSSSPYAGTQKWPPHSPSPRTTVGRTPPSSEQSLRRRSGCFMLGIDQVDGGAAADRVLVDQDAAAVGRLEHRLVDHGLGRPHPHRRAAGQEQQAVAELRREAQVVRDEHDGQPALAAEPSEKPGALGLVAQVRDARSARRAPAGAAPGPAPVPASRAGARRRSAGRAGSPGARARPRPPWPGGRRRDPRGSRRSGWARADSGPSAPAPPRCGESHAARPAAPPRPGVPPRPAVSPATSVPSMRIRPAEELHDPRQQANQRGLARGIRADDAEGLARAHLERLRSRMAKAPATADAVREAHPPQRDQRGRHGPTSGARARRR